MAPFPTVILLATDGSEGTRIASRMAAGIAEGTGSELHLVYVGATRGQIRGFMSRCDKAHMPFTAPCSPHDVPFDPFRGAPQAMCPYISVAREEILTPLEGDLPVALASKPRYGSPAARLIPSRANTQRRRRVSLRAGQDRLASQFDGLGGTEYSTRTIPGPHRHVGLGAASQDGRLESVSGNRPQRF
jgi:hypothetical protein